MHRLIINNVKVVGFLGLLALLFVFLKLNGTIVWSWWWVLAPLWVPFAVFIFIFVLILCIVHISGLIKPKKR